MGGRGVQVRLYPTDDQAAELSRTFGGVRLVDNRAHEARTAAGYGEQRRVSYVESSAMLTEWKADPEPAFLAEVSSVPLQQGLQARTAKGSNNRAKARRAVSKMYARIADRRRDHLHTLSTRLVRENRTVVIEDLSVRNTVRNHRLTRTISDAAWSEPRAMLTYKREWYGRNLVVIDRFHPSSTLCSACGTAQDTMALNVREWTCRCGTTHDRDVNAAIDIRAAGTAVIACGDDVRPPRQSLTGRLSMKQEP